MLQHVSASVLSVHGFPFASILCFDLALPGLSPHSSIILTDGTCYYAVFWKLVNTTGIIHSRKDLTQLLTNPEPA